MKVNAKRPDSVLARHRANFAALQCAESTFGEPLVELTKLQLQAYKSFGFVIVPGFLTPERVEALRDSCTAMKTKESGEANPLAHRGRIIGMFHKDKTQAELFDDQGLHDIATQLLGSQRPIRFLADEYASFSTPADWHPDMGVNEEFESLKFGFYLDDLSRGGCLRVVPGSHTPELHKLVETYRATEQPAAEMPWAYSCVTKPGDLLVFNLKLWHQGTANPAGTHRRVIFWSVGQGLPGFNQYARKFNDNVGRGKENEPWPESFIENAPKRRLEYLRFYESGTLKAKALEV